MNQFAPKKALRRKVDSPEPSYKGDAQSQSVEARADTQSSKEYLELPQINNKHTVPESRGSPQP